MKSNSHPIATSATSAGFTLLEVLLALALFSITAAVLAQTCSNLLYSQYHLRSAAEHDGALLWLQHHLLRITEREQLEQGGQIDLPDGRRVEWSAQLTPTAIVDVFDLTFHLIIQQPATSRPLHRSLQRTIYRASWMEEAEKSPLIRQREQDWQQIQRDRNLPLQ